MRVRAFSIAVLLACGSAVYAQQGAAPAPQSQEQDPDKPISFEQQVVVSASRTEQQLINAPAAVSIITSQTIETSPAASVGELLRSVPGMNVTQVSARDVNLTTRGATSTLATNQLTLVDGRTVYLDFFGMVMWDLIPTTSHEIDRIEVIRGPASAVWGANAMNGVVNVITKTPRQLVASGRGTSLTIGAGYFDRDAQGRDQDAGSLFHVSGSHAQIVDDRWSFKLSAGWLTQDPLTRPTGIIANSFNTPYPAYTNEGTSQPKFNGRVDYDVPGGARFTVSGGVAGTEGIIHSGIGPFDISSESRLTYLSAAYQKAGRRVAFFTNLLHGDASNLLTRGVDGQPIGLGFDTKTFDIEAGDVRTIGMRHVLTYGGNYRRNTFDITLTPAGDDRNEGGGYIQDEIFINNYLRWVIGTRLDKFSSIDDAVFSPRTALLFKPAPAHTVRASFNRAFRAPSHINNHLDVTVVTPVVLPVVGLFAFPTRAQGNPDLQQESMTAWELGYTGVLASRATVTASVYWNNTRDGIYFTPVEAYSPVNPPPGWPLPPAFVPPNVLTSRYTYLNIGEVKDKGIELGVNGVINRYLSAFTNYSYQWMPEIENFRPGTSITEINWPPKNRFNAGVDVNYSRFFGNFSVNYTDEAYWQDVLDVRFAGTTESYTLLNGAIGARWLDDRVTTSLKLTNLANDEIMQHIFGDILKRQVVAEVRVEF
jgi:outer membrane receptor for ferrienterochelin and colicin